MLSKCANPECSEMFRYIHEGKIFYLDPTPEVTIATGMLHPELQERFWLCARCSKELTLIWGGTKVKLVRLPIEATATPLPPAPKNGMGRRRPRARAVFAGREDRG
jgi:hypothetical protein